MLHLAATERYYQLNTFGRNGETRIMPSKTMEHTDDLGEEGKKRTIRAIALTIT